ncbi:uncharacterized protein LACBIDRAFT_316903 [Laccaria bicolor S238N-H82]|uniref:Predicted protein n=1 Tax=Laccaria bicolor (strain S238N-H82 / ATCC MYA-4686) TaxID=486041 RepID=B0D586_LACBS|nr:uncharacterized protein LACBIDRAFT_316903 [Laccaria bicolor S238N-H82]EDR10471.1 predicted protein [Laccaria bicolor S238N-H82]|eukprot:XP_001878921.1 predicted protein [Laccaria bicolor S238N-H82]
MTMTTSTTSLPAYPPKVHEQAKIISKQPLRAAEMEVSTPRVKQDGGEGALRLRGGCIPCPDGGCCYIIPIPCCC